MKPTFRLSRASFSPQVLGSIEISGLIYVTVVEKPTRRNSFGFKKFHQIGGKSDGTV
jgi:hypothetical protein